MSVMHQVAVWMLAALAARCAWRVAAELFVAWYSGVQTGRESSFRRRFVVDVVVALLGLLAAVVAVGSMFR